MSWEKFQLTRTAIQTTNRGVEKGRGSLPEHFSYEPKLGKFILSNIVHIAEQPAPVDQCPQSQTRT